MAESVTTRLPRGLFFKQIIRKIFFEDWLIKLVALMVTFALWLGVTGLSTPTTTRLSAIPFEFRFPSDVQVTNDPVGEIDVIISGDSRKIAQIQKRDLSAYVDLTGVAPGDRVIQLSAENVQLNLPPGVRLDEITPNRMAVRLEAIEEKEIPIKVEIMGKPAEGFEVYSQTANPVRVGIRGPLSLTKSLSQIITEKVDVDGRNADFIARQTPLTSPNPKLSLRSTDVDVNIKIGERRIERTLTVTANDGSGKRVSVTLFGGKTELGQLKPEDMQVEIVKNNSGVDIPEVTLPSQLQQSIEIRKTKLLS